MASDLSLSGQYKPHPFDKARLARQAMMAAAVAYGLLHIGALCIFREQAKVISYGFLILAPLLATAACVVCGRASPARAHWYALALSLLLWDAGMATAFYMDVVAPVSTDLSGLSMLFYVLYGVPLTFVVASPREDIRPARLIDAALAIILGGLFFAGIFTFATLKGTDAAGMLQLRLMLDMQNLFLLTFTLVRYKASDDPAQKDFFRTATLFAGIYALVAAYINHTQMDASYGGLADVLIGVPFLALCVMAAVRLTGPVRTRAALASPRLSLIVRTASPIMLPLTLFALSCLLVFYKPGLAVAGFVTALIGYGARTVLLQLRAQADNSRLEQLTRIDPLTQLANRRTFDETLESEFRRSLRSGQSLSLLMIDIDHFKMLNDTYGHPEGDRYLRRVSQVLAACASRRSDLVARYGGEEFAIVLPDIGEEAAAHIAQKILNSVVGLALPAPSARGIVTVSIGLASTERTQTLTASHLLACADAALYKAKQSGRNQVMRGDIAPADGIRVPH